MTDAVQQQAKRRVAERALDFVQDGMRVGLGTGSTAAAFVELLGERVRAGLTLRCVPTSEATRRQAEALGLDVTTLDELPELDLTVDGADEVDPQLRLIKGGGGALLREKIVATASAAMVVIADGSKMVDRLGTFPLPVEVNRFGLAATTRLVRQAIGDTGHAGEIRLRSGQDGRPFVTDGGHFILDCHLSAIQDAALLGASLWGVPGVVEHGLFIGIATAVVTERDGGVVVIQRNS